MIRPDAFEAYDPEKYRHYLDYMKQSTDLWDRRKRQSSVLGNGLLPFVVESVKLVNKTTQESVDAASLSPASLYKYPDKLGRSFREVPEVSHYVGRQNGRAVGLVVRIPVGQYGETLARELADTVEISYEALEPLTPDSMITKGRYKKILEEGTFQIEPLKIVQEAYLTTAHGLALLTLDQVEGYEDNPEGLIKAVVDEGLLSKLAARIPLGYVGPFANEGYKFINPVVSYKVGDDTRVRFSDEFESQLNRWRLKRRDQGIGGSSETGMGCPFVRKFKITSDVPESGVDYVAGSFLHVFNLVHKDPQGIPFPRGENA